MKTLTLLEKMSSLHLGLLNGTFLNFVKLEALCISLNEN